MEDTDELPILQVQDMRELLADSPVRVVRAAVSHVDAEAVGYDPYNTALAVSKNKYDD
jgi:hypothetical protein